MYGSTASQKRESQQIITTQKSIHSLKINIEQCIQIQILRKSLHKM